MKKNVSIEYTKAVDFEMEFNDDREDDYLFPMMGRSYKGETDYDVSVSEPYGGFWGFGQKVDINNGYMIHYGVPVRAFKYIETPTEWKSNER